MRTHQTVLATVCAATLAAAPGAAQSARRPPTCAPDNAGLTLPPGFCAAIAADSLGPIRHVIVAPNGDVFAAVRGRRNGPAGGVLALRDTDGDGVLETRARFGPGGGSGIALGGGFLYFATDDAIVRWRWAAGQLEPAGPPDTIAFGLTNRGQHAAKTIALSRDGGVFVNIGAPANSCQEQDRTRGSPGRDPCPLLEIAGGIWRFPADGRGLAQAQGERFATGIRNAVAITVDPSGVPYAAQHGRDDLAGHWPDLFNAQQSAEIPAEELYRIERGGDYGWPYCMYDPLAKKKVLMPEYGGNGREVGRCDTVRQPEVAFPGHWAPEALAFYTGTQFPARYRGGLFISFHGSWNRAPLPQAGFNVAFVPFGAGRPSGPYVVFADGFAGGPVEPGRAAAHRPMGVAVGPDGSLYVGDDAGGRLYRIVYRGN